MRYFEFIYIETKDGKIAKEGTGLYFTSAEENLDEIKSIVKRNLKNEDAVISILHNTEINYHTYIEKAGDPSNV